MHGELFSLSDFGQRLKEAFGTPEIAELARKLGVTYQAAKNYVDGRIPSPETLISISSSTGCSIDWLLTGKGEKYPTRSKASFHSRLQAKLDQIAREQAQEIFGDADIAAGNAEERTRELLVEYLLNRALQRVSLLEEGHWLMKAEDRRRAERFTFIRNLEPSIEERIRQVVQAELSKVGGEVSDLEPAEMIAVQHFGTVGGGEPEDYEAAEAERKRKAG